jgi:hypothetical protein
MDISKITNQTWVNMLKADKEISFEFLALQLVFFRLKNKVKKDPTAAAAAAEELKKFFVSNEKIPVAMKELEKLINMR